MCVVADLLDSRREEGQGSAGPGPMDPKGGAADKSVADTVGLKPKDFKGAAEAEMHEDASTSPDSGNGALSQGCS